jgi:hypothetical protein
MLGIFHFPSFDRRKIEASFTGGNVTSDGGILLLRAADWSPRWSACSPMRAIRCSSPTRRWVSCVSAA